LKIRRIRDGNHICGRWQPDEHQRFIEAILKYGNEWKLVQKHVGTRSSTQARSHAQKFFVKMKKSSLINFDVDFSKNSIKSLHSIASNLTKEEYLNAIKALNCVAFERKSLPKRNLRDDDELESLFDDTYSNLFK
jgi:SHAQKYF class myb-like DNA-binding protein